MKSHIHTAAALFLASLVVMAIGACSSSSSPTAEDGISSLKGIDGAFDESGSDGVHPDTWKDNHQGLAQADLASCISCHADTSVDEQGCLPCHDGGGEADDAGEKENPHPDGWEDNHRKTPPAGLAGCMACHADTSVHEQGCLPCHTGSDEADDEGDDEADDEADDEGDDD